MTLTTTNFVLVFGRRVIVDVFVTVLVVLAEVVLKPPDEAVAVAWPVSAVPLVAKMVGVEAD